MGVTIKYKGNQIASMNESGTKTLNTSGKYCEGDFAVDYTVDSSAPSEPAEVNSKRFVVTTTADVSGKWFVFNQGGDADLAAHRADATMNVSWYRTNDHSASAGAQSFQGGNIAHGTYYGSCIVRTSSAYSASYVSDPLTGSTSAAAKKTIITEDGTIQTYGSSSYPMRAGTYICIATW